MWDNINEMRKKIEDMRLRIEEHEIIVNQPPPLLESNVPTSDGSISRWMIGPSGLRQQI